MKAIRSAFDLAIFIVAVVPLQMIKGLGNFPASLLAMVSNSFLYPFDHDQIRGIPKSVEDTYL